MTIAFLTDTHTNRDTEGDRTAYRGRFERAIAAVNAEEFDLVLHGGDMTESGLSDEIDDFAALARGLKRRPLTVPGNHDVGGKVHPEQKSPVDAARVAAHETRFGRSWWSRTVRKVRVVGINSPILGSGLDAEARQWRFLERELSRPDAPPTVLLTHFPLFLKDPDEASDPYWNVEPEPRRRLLELLGRPSARLAGVLSGHLHRPLSLTWRGVPLITSPPVAFGLPIGRQPEGWHRVRIDGDTVQSVFHEIRR